MSEEPTTLLEEDLERARDAAAGSEEALVAIRNEYFENLKSFLLSRGAQLHDAEDIVAAVFAEAVSDGKKKSLFEKYSGRAPLGSWLRTIVINRFYTLMRRRRHEVQTSDGESPVGENEPAPEGTREGQDALAELLQDGLRHALASLDAEKLLLLRLVYLHGIDQRALAALWPIHEANISRAMTSAMESLRDDAMTHIRGQDAAIDLDWDELLEVCRTFNLEQIFSDS